MIEGVIIIGGTFICAMFIKSLLAWVGDVTTFVADENYREYMNG
jgi:hypothetical protein